jgi:nicotinate-nucleotide pyrophosphorylase (carboxylating)
MPDINNLLSFIREDAPFGDITSDSLILADERCRAVTLAKSRGIIAGLEEGEMLFRYYGAEVTSEVRDGDTVSPGAVVMAIEGPAKGILLAERTVLNIIGRMSGIATRTRNIADLLESTGSPCRIAATRKTAPGLRALDKKAVRIGGGDPHRMSLSDGILIKDNHLVLVPLETAILRAKRSSLYRKVEVEVTSEQEAVVAAEAGADILLLDNMTPAMVRGTINRLEESGLRKNVLVELSGGINEENLPAYRIPGIDLISAGVLTHSVVNFDVSLEIVSKIR